MAIMSKRTTSNFFLVVGLLVCLIVVLALGVLTFYWAWKGEWLGIVAVFIAHSVGYWTRATK
jgi:hypothetical protein